MTMRMPKTLRAASEFRVRIWRALQRGMADALDLVYPHACAGCDRPMGSEKGILCWDCRSSLRMITAPCCSKCGNPLEGRADHAYSCYHCAGLEPAFDLARSAMRFEGVAAEIIHRFKYRQALWLRDELADWLTACVRVWYPSFQPDFVCPVPLHRTRARERGYNQSALLASGLARRIGCPFRDDALVRTRATETQTHLTARQRLSNVSQAFKAAPAHRLTGRTVLLVDDVMTTGATVSACARALKDAGCGVVCVVTLARGQ
jgi:ComF family protein